MLSSRAICSGMHHQGKVTSLSWIPSEAVEGSMRIPFDAGMAQFARS